MATNTKKAVLFQQWGDGDIFTHLVFTCSEETQKEYDHRPLGLTKSGFYIADIIVDHEDNFCDKMEIFLPHFGDGLFLTWDDQRKKWNNKYR
jgi:hypothetical protein